MVYSCNNVAVYNVFDSLNVAVSENDNKIDVLQLTPIICIKM